MIAQSFSAMRHASEARRLIAACGGLDEAAEACRYSPAQLSRCQTPSSGCFLAADIIDQLETYCGQNLYSAALTEARPTNHSGDLADDTADETEHAAALQAAARRVKAKGRPDASDCLELRRLLAEMETSVTRVRADVDGAGCPR